MKVEGEGEGRWHARHCTSRRLSRPCWRCCRGSRVVVVVVCVSGSGMEMAGLMAGSTIAIKAVEGSLVGTEYHWRV